MKRLRFFVFLLLLAALPGCGGGSPQSADVLAMDTVMKLTVYGQTEGQGEAALQKAVDEIKALEGLLSVTDESSEIYRANHSPGRAVPLSEPTRTLLSDALALCAATDGALDVTVYPIVRAWGFTTGACRIPVEEEIQSLLAQVDYSRVFLDGDALTLPVGTELDLGAVAKGFAGDRLMALFRKEGVESAIVELGGNVHALGCKPDGSPWQVALQAPEGGFAGVLEIVDKAVVTSGGYQRFFEKDGARYIHIIDPKTGYPAETGLASATIVAGSGLLGDGLSTALFVMGRERAEAYWRTHGGFEFVLLTETGRAVISEGLEGCFHLYGEWENRPVEVVRR